MPKAKIVITGGAGFVGTHLSRRLLNMGFEVHVIDNLVSGKKENVQKGSVFHKFDIRDYKKIEPVFKKASYVFHLAALPNVEYSIQNPTISHSVNVDGTLNVLLASQKANIRKLIFASSCSIYGEGNNHKMTEGSEVNPKSPYALQKFVCEEYMKLWSKLYKINTISLRFFNIYGPLQRSSGPYAFVIAIFLRLKSLGKPLTITGTGSQKRDFIHIEDVVSACIKCLYTKTTAGDVINIGSGKNISVNEIAKIIGGNIIHLPQRIEPKSTLANNTKARRILGWEPKIKVRDGIKNLI